MLFWIRCIFIQECVFVLCCFAVHATISSSAWFPLNFAGILCNNLEQMKIVSAFCNYTVHDQVHTKFFFLKPWCMLQPILHDCCPFG